MHSPDLAGQGGGNAIPACSCPSTSPRALGTLCAIDPNKSSSGAHASHSGSLSASLRVSWVAAQPRVAVVACPINASVGSCTRPPMAVSIA